jgi:hypothetical protein
LTFAEWSKALQLPRTSHFDLDISSFPSAVRTFSVLTVLRAHRIAWVSGGNSRHQHQNAVCYAAANVDTGSGK